MTEIGQPTSEPMDDELLRVSVPIRGERGGLTLVMSIDRNGRLNGLQLTTDEPGTRPSTPIRRSFKEREITIGSAPRGPGNAEHAERTGPWPRVVLLSGGGPFDATGPAGPNKPMKDLAWGLASQGIAVLRFDKSPLHQPELTGRAGFHDDRGVRPARDRRRSSCSGSNHPSIGRTCVGHSMGGKVAPRVARRHRPSPDW